MRKEEFERRAADMKARLLAQRNRRAEKAAATSVRKAMTKEGQEDSRLRLRNPRRILSASSNTISSNTATSDAINGEISVGLSRRAGFTGI